MTKLPVHLDPSKAQQQEASSILPLHQKPQQHPSHFCPPKKKLIFNKGDNNQKTYL